MGTFERLRQLGDADACILAESPDEDVVIQVFIFVCLLALFFFFWFFRPGLHAGGGIELHEVGLVTGLAVANPLPAGVSFVG